MITPAFNLTATERVLPRMALDFTTASLDSRVTVTRALNTATRTNSSGYIEIVNANLPRFDFSPTSIGTCRGLLIEESRANLFTRSAEFEDVIWPKVAVSVNANTTATLAPDGTQTADNLVEDTTANIRYIQYNPGTVGTVGATETFSLFAKTAGRSWIRLTIGANNFAYFNVANGTVGTIGGTVTTSIISVGNGWYRCAVSCVRATNQNNIIYLASADNTLTYTGDGTSGIYLWGAQLETGAFPTSYIPTTTTSLTRNADNVSMTGTNFSSWYNATEGSFSVIGSSLAARNTVTPAFWSVSDGTNLNYMGTFADDSSGKPQFVAWNGGALQAGLDADPFSITANVPYAVAAAYKASSFAMVTNGATIKTNPTGTLPTVNRLGIGNRHGNSRFLSGHIRKINYWNQRITNAEVQAFSKI